MSSNIYNAGLRNVGSYQVSGHPYLSGAVTHNEMGSASKSYFRFPYVTKKIIVTNNDGSNNAMISFAPFLQSEVSSYPEFSANSFASGSGNWLYLAAGTTIELNVKCRDLFISPVNNTAVDHVVVYAELTNIPSGSMYSFDAVEGISA